MFYNKKIFKRCFNWRGKYWYKNIKEIPLYFKQLHHLIKHGYDVGAHWETYGWFLDTFRPILKYYRENHYGTPVLIDDFPADTGTPEGKAKADENSAKWNVIVDRMIELLDLMDECNPKYDAPEYEEDLWLADREMNSAKDEFFKLFAKHFYSLWD